MSINHYIADQPLSDTFANLADEELDIRVLDLLSPQDCRIQANSGPSLSIAYYAEGAGWRQFADTPFMLLGADTCCLYHGTVAIQGEGLLPANTRVRGVNISFAPQVLSRIGLDQQLLDQAGQWERRISADGQARLVQFRAPPALRKVGLAMLDCPLQGVAREIFLRGKAFEMLAEMVGYLQSGASRPLLGARDRGRIEQARELLRRHPAEPWTLETLAEAVTLTVRKLKQGFRDLYGKGAYAVLQDLRMELAAERLQRGERVVDTALEVGYSNASHFAKVFRRHHGTSPSDYRNHCDITGK
ncbi:helix-turn-helix transcriptional regulator [Pseudomonas sp. S31]|uniref:helix-turn-helix transcriptional regulator n=1 Tax=Pseudomonas sp. S31 TaxID=1564473 RepID=UPI001914B810|nr:AraC family transcriptional regulator [Pseudomonas sp. S31]MBK5002834.1 helix-turn-helix transcriptional regulator [Pseudomonas sp. S31]